LVCQEKSERKIRVYNYSETGADRLAAEKVGCIPDLLSALPQNREPRGRWYLEATENGPALESRLTKVGRDAFEELCQKGCDRRILSNLFLLLSAPSCVRLKTGQTIELRAEARSILGPDYGAKTGHTIELSAGDSSERLLCPVAEDELPRIARRAEKLLCDIERLRRTRLIRRLVADGRLPDDDLLGGSPLLEIKRAYFHGLLHLAELAGGFGARQRPDYTRRLKAIFKHIRECTGRWHDGRVADILDDLLPNPQKPYNAESLKVWRNEHGLSDSVSRKPPKK
jgi:hypothetical protein